MAISVATRLLFSTLSIFQETWHLDIHLHRSEEEPHLAQLRHLYCAYLPCDYLGKLQPDKIFSTTIKKLDNVLQ